MSIVAITGASGIGKSFLAKQLCSYLSVPVILEGEEGTIPNWVFKNVFSGEDPTERWKFFIERHNAIYANAHKISQVGLPCLLDVHPCMVDVLKGYEKEQYLSKIEEIASMLDSLSYSVTVLLTAKEETLRDMIRQRGRLSENDIEQTVQRSLYIQEKLLGLLGENSNTIVLERDDYDFAKESDLEEIYEKLRKWLS